MTGVDLSEVMGLHVARRALEIAAAGGHGLLLLGPNGAGKQMLARRLPTILPALTLSEDAEIRRAYARTSIPIPKGRPFRAPHFQATDAAMIGGGAPVRPGEVSLAHRGVLFLDDATSFRRNAIDGVQWALDNGEVRFRRGGVEHVFPARPLVVLSAARCPCGEPNSFKRVCLCRREDVTRHQKQVTRALRCVDVVARVDAIDGARHPRPESSAEVMRRVMAARTWQARRFAENDARPPDNAELELCYVLRSLDRAAQGLFQQALERLALSSHEQAKVLRVARTIADLDTSDAIRPAHVAEAVQIAATHAAPILGATSA